MLNFKLKNYPMSSFITILPQGQIDQLKNTYVKKQKRESIIILIGFLVFALLLFLSWRVADVRLDVFYTHIGSFFNYFTRIFKLDNGSFVLTNPQDWYWGFFRWLRLLWETILISYSATIFGTLLAFVASFMQARNLGNSPIISFIIKRVLEFCRTVPDIVFALIFIVAFGLGPLPGVLAILLHTTGTLGKQFSETIDNINMKPVDGLRATGASWLSTVRFGVVPQVITSYLSYSLLRFEINVRGASVLGFVGAGGIGQDLIEAIRKFYYSDVSAILCMIILTVFVIDLLTEKMRHAVLKLEVRS